MDATTPPSLADDIAEALAYANQGPSLSRETTRRLVRELTERTAGLDHLQRLFRLATRVEQRVGDAVVCSCTWSYGRPGVRTARPAGCRVHGALLDGQPTEPTEADPQDSRPAAKAHRAETGHQMAHISADASSCADCDWSTSEQITDPRDGSLADGEIEHALAALAALRYVIASPTSKLKEMAYDEVKGLILRLRALVGGRPAAPTREQAVAVVKTTRVGAEWDHITDRSAVPSVVIPHPIGTQVVVALLSRSAAEPPDDAPDLSQPQGWEEIDTL